MINNHVVIMMMIIMIISVKDNSLPSLMIDYDRLGGVYKPCKASRGGWNQHL